MFVVLAFGILLLVVITTIVYQQITRLRRLVAATWIDVESALAQRHDLMHTLAVRLGACGQTDRSALDAVRMASSLTGTAQGQERDSHRQQERAELIISGAMRHAITQAASQPAVAASTRCDELRLELTVVEAEIERALDAYNRCVTELNGLLVRFPGVLIKATGYCTPAIPFQMGAAYVTAQLAIS